MPASCAPPAGEFGPSRRKGASNGRLAAPRIGLATHCEGSSCAHPEARLDAIRRLAALATRRLGKQPRQRSLFILAPLRILTRVRVISSGAASRSDPNGTDLSGRRHLHCCHPSERWVPFLPTDASMKRSSWIPVLAGMTRSERRRLSRRHSTQSRFSPRYGFSSETGGKVRLWRRAAH